MAIGAYIFRLISGKRVLSLFLLTGITVSVFSAASAGPTDRLVVVVSSTKHEYELASNAFLNTLIENNKSIVTEKRLFLQAQSDENKFWESIKQNQPIMIVTVGTPATSSAQKYVSGIPVVCTMIFGGGNNSFSIVSGKDSSSELVGVSLSIEFQRQLEILRNSLPTARRVGLLYTDSLEMGLHPIRTTAQNLGLRLIESQVENTRDIPGALKKIIDEIDILWIPPSLEIYRQGALNYILEECYRNNVPVAAFSKQLAIAGAALSIGIDYEDIGRQTAELVIEQLSSEVHRESTGLVHPRTVLLYINEPVVAGLGLHIPKKVMRQAIIVGRKDGVK